MRVMISYRRGDARHIAGRLRDHLSWEPDVAELFLDMQSIALGERFPERIHDAIARATHVLVVIGPAWDGGPGGERAHGAALQPMGAVERSRLFDADDFVRQEVATALAPDAHRQVIPVLVDGAAMPPPDRVPTELQPLLLRQAFTIHNDHNFALEIKPLLRHVLGHEPRGGDGWASIALTAGLGAGLGFAGFLLFSAVVQFGFGLDAHSFFSFTDHTSAQVLWQLLPPLSIAIGACALPLLRRRWRIGLPSRRSAARKQEPKRPRPKQRPGPR